MSIVDVWAQITTERMAKRPWLEPLMRWTGRSGEHLASSVEKTLAAMDDGGVDIRRYNLAAIRAFHGKLVSGGNQRACQEHRDNSQSNDVHSCLMLRLNRYSSWRRPTPNLTRRCISNSVVNGWPT